MNPQPIRSLRRTGGVALGIAVLMLATDNTAQARNRGSIKFRRGSISKTVSATARRDNPDCWTFGASEGQRVSYNVTGDARAALIDAEFEVGDPVRLQEQLEEYGGRSSTQSVVESGTQQICVATQSLSSSRYNLTLKIR
jgi:translation initiation factor IF-2